MNSFSVGLVCRLHRCGADWRFYVPRSATFMLSRRAHRLLLHCR